MLAWLPPNPPTLCCCRAECLRGSQRIYPPFGQLGACADAWVAPSTGERRRRRAMPTLSMNTKKPMKPMLEILAITDDAGLTSPTPASERPDEQTKPSDPRQQRVLRVATAYRGTTTPKARKLPAALATTALAAKVPLALN